MIFAKTGCHYVLGVSGRFFVLQDRVWYVVLVEEAGRHNGPLCFDLLLDLRRDAGTIIRAPVAHERDIV